jgi:predicted transcriptional regulator
MDHQTDQRLKKILNLWHKEVDLTQRSAAIELGISQSAVCQYLRGNIPLNLKIVIKFAKLLKVSPIEIDPDLNF